MFDAPTIQSVGAALGGAGAIVGAIVTVSSRTKIGSFFRKTETIVNENKELGKRLQDALRQVDSSHKLADDYKGSLEASQARFEDFSAMTSARLKQLEDVKPKYDALLAWSRDVMEYCMWIETRAKVGGIDLSARSMPPVPAILAEQLETKQ